jgi:hypothetical protein
MTKLVLSERQPGLTDLGAVDQESSPRSPTSCRDHMAKPCHRVQPGKARRGDQQRIAHSQQRKHRVGAPPHSHRTIMIAADGRLSLPMSPSPTALASTLMPIPHREAVGTDPSTTERELNCGKIENHLTAHFAF